MTHIMENMKNTGENEFTAGDQVVFPMSACNESCKLRGFFSVGVLRERIKAGPDGYWLVTPMLFEGLNAGVQPGDADEVIMTSNIKRLSDYF